MISLRKDFVYFIIFGKKQLLQDSPKFYIYPFFASVHVNDLSQVTEASSSNVILCQRATSERKRSCRNFAFNYHSDFTLSLRELTTFEGRLLFQKIELTDFKLVFFPYRLACPRTFFILRNGLYKTLFFYSFLEGSSSVVRCTWGNVVGFPFGAGTASCCKSACVLKQ